MPLRLGHLREIDLRFELLDKAASADDRHLAAVFVHRALLGTKHITRRLIVGDILLVVKVLILQRVAVTTSIKAIVRLVVLVKLIEPFG